MFTTEVLYGVGALALMQVLVWGIQASQPRE